MKKVKIIIFTGFTVVAVILLFLVFRGFSQMQPSQPLNQAIAEKELTHNDVLLAAEKKYKISQFYDFNAEEKALVQKFGLESQKDIANPRGSGDQVVYVQTNLFNYNDPADFYYRLILQKLGQEPVEVWRSNNLKDKYYIPFIWTVNGKKFILDNFVLDDSRRTGWSVIQTLFVLDPETKKIDFLAEANFALNDLKTVAYITNNNNLPNICPAALTSYCNSPEANNNLGRLIVKDIESNTVIREFTAKNTIYPCSELSFDRNVVYFKTVKLEKSSAGCWDYGADTEFMAYDFLQNQLVSEKNDFSDISNWLTADKSNFSFQYPQDWILQDNGLYYITDHSSGEGEPLDAHNIMINFQVSAEIEAKNINDVVAAIDFTEGMTKSEELLLDNKAAKIVWHKDDLGDPVVSAYLFDADKKLKASLTAWPADSQYFDIFMKIVESFRFKK